MRRYPVDVSLSGAVLLGSGVVCDGFLAGARARVQTHVHEDHMDEFDTSKGFQDILATEATRHLLCAEKDAELPYRSNVIGLREGQSYTIGGSHVALLSSGHMLGSAQVEVTTRDGRRLGYSGDFAWPLDRIIKVDALVVDSTYGSPDQIRRFTQGECEARFLELILARLRRGPVNVLAYRGTMHRALQILSGAVRCPLVGSPDLCREVEVYREFGYAIRSLVSVGSQRGVEARESGKHIRFYGRGDKWPVDTGRATNIVLSGYGSRLDDPVTQYSETSYNIAVSNHADHAGSIEYVKATGARFVITDKSRGGKAYELASAIKTRLAIEARPSSDFGGREWGGGGVPLGNPEG